MLFFDDQFPIHRKVAGLSDAAFRLHVSAIFWCARNLTDGVVPEEDLDDVCARVRTPARFAAECVRRGAWHEIGTECGSEACPGHVDIPSNGVTKGWVIHDYFDWQRSKERVMRERRDNAARQKKWRDQQKQKTEAHNGVSNGVSNSASNAAPSRPVPSRRDGGSLSDHSAGDQSVRAGARELEAARWLHQRYRLTDDESRLVIAEVQRRAGTIRASLVAYMSGRMTENGTLADIVGAVQTASEQPAEQREHPSQPLTVVPDWCGRCDEFTRMCGDPDRPARCPDCNPNVNREAS